MSGVVARPPFFLLLSLVRSESALFLLGQENPQQVVAFSVIHVLLKATAGYIFTLTRIGSCAAGTGSHFTSVDSASGLLALLSSQLTCILSSVAR